MESTDYGRERSNIKYNNKGDQELFPSVVSRGEGEDKYAFCSSLALIHFRVGPATWFIPFSGEHYFCYVNEL